MDHSQEFLAIVDDARSRITECDVAEARERIAKGATLIDVREDNEFERDHAEGARHMGRGIIERDSADLSGQGDGVDTLLRRRLSLRVGGRHAAKNGLHQCYIDGRRLEGLERRRRADEPRLETMSKEERRARARELAEEFEGRGDTLGWFEVFYKEAGSNNENIPWADLEPNHYLVQWVKENDLHGDGRTALVVGCGLGDDAKYLSDLGFKVTAFDISPTAIDWAQKLYGDAAITFEVADLFNPPQEWLGAFDFVLEIYTIQPLPLEIRPQVIDAIASFVRENGKLVVVTRGREDDEEPEQMPWPLSRRDLSRFEKSGLRQISFTVMPSLEEDEPNRFVVEYEMLK